MWNLRIGGVVMAITGAVLVWFGYQTPIARGGLWGAGFPLMIAGVAMLTFLPRMLGMGGSGAIRKRGGLPGTARVLAVHDTGVTINDLTAIFKIDAEITTPGRAPYQASFRLPVGRTQWGAIQPGATLPVLVDPSDPRKVAYDEQGAGRAAQPVAQAIANAAPQIVRTMSSRDVVVRGQHAQGTVLGAQLTGRTAGELSQSALPPDQADDPVAIVQLRVEPATGAAFDAASAMRIPDGKQALLAPGTRVPVAYLVENPSATVTIDWDRA